MPHEPQTSQKPGSPGLTVTIYDAGEAALCRKSACIRERNVLRGIEKFARHLMRPLPKGEGMDRNHRLWSPAGDPYIAVGTTGGRPRDGGHQAPRTARKAALP